MTTLRTRTDAAGIVHRLRAWAESSRVDETQAGWLLDAADLIEAGSREATKLSMELDSSCNAEELRQAREENSKLREIAALYLDRLESDGVEYEQQADLRKLLGKF